MTTPTARPATGRGTWSKAPAFGDDRAEALRESTARDRERYLTTGLVSVDCRFCHVAVDVKKLGPAHTSVQWNSEATQRCAYFADIRAVRRRPRPRPVLPEARRQHQTRCRRRLPGGDVVSAVPRRRLVPVREPGPRVSWDVNLPEIRRVAGFLCSRLSCGPCSRWLFRAAPRWSTRHRRRRRRWRRSRRDRSPTC